MSVLAVYSIKGGVGKTATAVNLAYMSALQGHKTLICDLDPQSSTTFYFRVQPGMRKAVKKMTSQKGDLVGDIKGSDYPCLDILPADFSFRNLDLAFGDVKRSKKRLREALKALRFEYDLIILDAPPNLTLLSENIFYASDKVLIPVIPTTLSYRTLEKLMAFFKEEELNCERVLPFFSMVEKRKSMHSETIAQIKETWPHTLESGIPYLSDVERMGYTREPVFVTKPRSAAAKAYIDLWAEVKPMLGL